MITRNIDMNVQWKLRGSYLISMISIALVLFLLGLIGFLFLNAQKISEHIRENVGFSIIIHDNTPEIEIIKLQKDLDVSLYVRSSEFIDKDRAAQELKSELGEDFIDFMGYNPLLASIDIKLKAEYSNVDSIAKIESQFLDYPQIKDVFYQKSLVNFVNENVGKISLYLGLFTILMLAIAYALISNTIRLSVQSKRFIIHTQKLVGATKAYIRQPFIWNSFLLGILSSFASIFLLSFVISGIHAQLDALLSFTEILMLLGVVSFIGIVITVFSTLIAVNYFISITSDELYY